MRGQISLEFIIVIAIFLGALAIWLTGVQDVQSAIGIAMGQQQENINADKLSTAINSVCVMGNGNELAMEFYFQQKTDSKNILSEKTIYCDFENIPLSGKQTITLSNENSFIRLDR